MTNHALYARTATVALLAALAVPAAAQEVTPPAGQIVTVPVPDIAIAPPATPIPTSPPTADIGDPESATPVNPAAVAQVEAERQARASTSAALDRAASSNPTVSQSRRNVSAAAPATVAPVTAIPASGTSAVTTAAPNATQTAGTPAVAEPTPRAADASATTAQGDAPSGGDGALLWGGLALLGLGGAGAAYAARRRRNDGAAYAEDEVVRVRSNPTPGERALDPELATALAMEAPRTEAPASARSPLAMPIQTASMRPATAPVPSERVAQPLSADGRAVGRHERAALAGPTTDNPFLTRKNRLKRARFYDRRERMVEEQALSARSDAAPRPWADAPAEQPMRGIARRTDADRAASRPLGGMKPAFS